MFNFNTSLRNYRLFGGLVLLFVCTTILGKSVLAHGPTRQKVTETIVIEASAEAVWNVIKDFGEVTWLSMVDKSESDNGNENGATRTLMLSSGVKIVETLKSYKGDKMSYKYRIPDATHDVAILPVSNYSSTISVKADGNKAIVTWKGAFYRGYPNNDPPEELNDEAAVKAVTELYKAGLKGLKELVES